MPRHSWFNHLLLVCCIFLCPQSFAGTAGSLASPAQYLSNYPVDFWHLLTAPVQFSQEDWLKAADVLGVGAALLAFDGNIRDAITDNQTPSLQNIANVVHPLGVWQVLAPGIVATYGLSYAVKDAHLRETALLSMESLVVSGAFVQILKTATHRVRPCSSGDDGSAYDFLGPGINGSQMSFPSGDAANAFAIASVVAHEYPDNRAVAIFSYGLASLVALERLELNKHYSSDVYFGAVIGYFTGSYLVKQHSSLQSKHLTIAPTINHGLGVEMTWVS